MIIGQWWSVICRRRGRREVGWQGSSSGRGRSRRCLDFSLNQLFIWYCSSPWRHGWLPPARSGSWGGHRTRWSSDLQGGSCNGGQTVSGTTPWSRRKGRRQGLIQCRNILIIGRTLPCSTFLRDRFWTYVRR